MASKLVAARIASWSGVRTVIANAEHEGVVAAIVAGETAGTTFEAHQRTLTARKLWIALAAETAGRITVDDGAQAALTTKTRASSRRASPKSMEHLILERRSRLLMQVALSLPEG